MSQNSCSFVGSVVVAIEVIDPDDTEDVGDETIDVVVEPNDAVAVAVADE